MQKLVDDGVIDSVVCQLKSGKEADLFVVEREPYHYVAKVYRERSVRSFKNDAGYREGRKVRNSRSQRALGKGTRFGRALAEKAWHTAEVDALRVLEAAGARVPRILAHHDRVLIMELICDDLGRPAPQLAQVPLSAEGAKEMFDRILEQVVLFLMNDLVHGDLSPYNVLVRGGEPVVIDMPQCISAAHNQQAGKILERDVRAITRHLGLIEPSVRAMGKEAWQIWAEYERGTLTAEFRPELGRQRPTGGMDMEGLVDFVKETKERADLERRAAEGDQDAKALLRAAERREAKRQRRVAEARMEAEAEAKAARREDAKRKRARSARHSRPGRKRSRGGKTTGRNEVRGEGKPAPAGDKKAEASGRDASPDGAKPKRRRRRKRRRGGGQGKGRPQAGT